MPSYYTVYIKIIFTMYSESYVKRSQCLITLEAYSHQLHILKVEN
jgi:hypothetical protein